MAATPGAFDPVNPALEARIAASPDDTTAWQAYADWLRAQGSVRGGLASLQLAREERRLESLRLKAEDLLDAHATTFFGPKDRSGDRIDGYAGSLVWKGGFWKQLEITASPKKLEQALALTSARLLQSLSVGLGSLDYSPVARTIAGRAEPLAALRRLTVGSDPEEQSSIVDAPRRRCFGLAEVAPNLPRLEALKLRVPNFDFGSFPTLRVLRLEAEELRGSALRALFEVDLPKLARLDILLASFDEDKPPPFAVADFAELLRGQHVPRLRHLALHVFGPEDLRAELDAAVEGSPLRQQLRTCVIDDEFDG